MRTWTKQCTKAFTLIELLVVISIIALLLAILLPSLRKAKAKAQRVVCLSYIKQVMLGTQVYSMNNDSKLPYSGRGFPWMGMLDFPSLLVSQGFDPKYFHCPADMGKPGFSAGLVG